MKSSNSRVWFGVILIILGGLFLMDNFGFFWFDLRPIVFSWHSILLIIGIVVLINHKDSVAGYILIAIGLIGTLKHTIPFFFDFDFSDLWPIIILLVGVWLIFKRNGHKHIDYKDYKYEGIPGTIHGAEKAKAEFSENDYVKIDCVFNSTKHVIHSDNFKGGSVSVVFGEIKLDLTNAKLAPGTNILETSNMFGSLIIRVPSDWKVQLNISSVFGGFDDKRYSISSAPSDGILVINGSTVFGGGKLIN